MELHLPPEYVLDKMEWYEINSLLKYRHYAVKESWEQSRLITYMIAQTNSKKHLKITDIIKFPWDDDEDEKECTKITTDDVKRLNEMAKEYLLDKRKY